MAVKKRKALSVAFKRAKGIREKLSQLKAENVNLSAPTEREQLSIKWAEEKAGREGGSYLQYLPGQAWYVSFLAQCQEASSQELLELQYNQVLPDYLSEDEMVAMLDNI